MRGLASILRVFRDRVFQRVEERKNHKPVVVAEWTDGCDFEFAAGTFHDGPREFPVRLGNIGRHDDERIRDALDDGEGIIGVSALGWHSWSPLIGWVPDHEGFGKGPRVERPWTETRWSEAEAGRLRLHRIEREGFAAKLRRLARDPRGWRWTWGRDLPLVFHTINEVRAHAGLPPVEGGEAAIEYLAAFSEEDLRSVFGMGWCEMDREIRGASFGTPAVERIRSGRDVLKEPSPATADRAIGGGSPSQIASALRLVGLPDRGEA